MQALRIAFKNVLRNSRRSLLLGSAIAFGFFILTFTNGFTSGLSNKVKDNFADSLGGHLYISGGEIASSTEEGKRGAWLPVIRNRDSLEKAVASIQDEVASQNYRTKAKAVLIWGRGQESVHLTGVDSDLEIDFLNGLRFIEGSLDTFLNNPSSIIIARSVAEGFDAEVGEKIIVRAETINGQVNVEDFVIAGIIATHNYNSDGYTHIKALNTVVDIGDSEFMTFNIHLKDVNKIGAISEKFRAELSNFAKVPSMPGDTNPPPNPMNQKEEFEDSTIYMVQNIDSRLSFFKNMTNTIDRVALGIFVIILIIIMVGLMNSYRMVMIERTTEIGTMRAMGVQKSDIRNIFVLEALFVALKGAVVGLVVALALMYVFSMVDFSQNEDFTFYLNKGKPFFSNSIIKISMHVFLVCSMNVLAVWIPARAAANLKPAEALRS